MALTASRTTQGFEWIYNKAGVSANPNLYELTPNTAFSKGDAVVLTAGKVAKAAANATNILGVMAETIAAADNPAAGLTYGLVYDNPFDVFRCSFADHRDAAATGGTSTTLIDTVLSTSTDDDWNGALLYIYEGPGAGDIRTVSDYTGATDVLTVAKAFTATPTTASKYILLGAGGAATADVINVGKVGIDLKDENTIDANATVASEAGPMVVLDINPKELTMDVMFRKHLYNA